MSGEGILPCNQKRPPVIAPPSSAASPSSPNHHSHHDKVRTIFISGLPTDVKERELQNLLRWLPGFEASQVSFKGKEPKGFALFSTAKFAVAAKDTLQEMVFDDKLKSLLHIEMAKKNLVVKKGMGTDSVAVDIYSCHPVPPVLPVPNPAPGERLQVFMCMINLGVMLKSLPQLLSKMNPGSPPQRIASMTSLDASRLRMRTLQIFCFFNYPVMLEFHEIGLY
ncbi:RNA-binding protein with multiple splicing-like [Hibiscus syriacus]|uniref:RNA-binding protein with multiple splicing-like n=1 Tax=Hibiscus syriacus TaxID=106335 RepID=UPI001924DE35|nr:RNA-binding protein with multiple splicing-like [Hibiscus syriacus]